MKLFGLTGGIGMGKSTCARLLARNGVAVIDTDVVAREIVEPGTPALEEIARHFGPEAFDAQGRLDRAAMARIVFGSSEKRKELEAILHPRIRERWLDQVAQWRQEGRESAAVVIPLLFETGAQNCFDAIVCVACSAATQQERLRARGWSGEQIQQRLDAQWPLEKKMAGATHVIWTEGDPAIHEQQIDRILAHHLPSRR